MDESLAEIGEVFTGVLGHMVVLIIVKCIVFLISFQIYKFVRNRCFPKVPKMSQLEELLYDRNDAYWVKDEGGDGSEDEESESDSEEEGGESFESEMKGGTKKESLDREIIEALQGIQRLKLKRRTAGTSEGNTSASRQRQPQEANRHKKNR